MISGCASSVRYDYVKEGASNHQKINDLSECEYNIRLNKTRAIEQKELLNLCMQGKGYRYKRVV